jgi:hypothetical protein
VQNRLTKAQRLAYKQFIKDMVLHFSEVSIIKHMQLRLKCT